MTERELERVRLLASLRDAIDLYLDFELGDREYGEEEPQPDGTLEALRDWAVMHEGRAFKASSIVEHFDISLPTTLKRLERLQELGIVERRGNASKTRYLYTPKTDPGAAALADMARKRKPPEIEAVEQMPGGNGHVKRGKPMPLLRAPNAGNKEVQELVDACHRAGWIAESGTKHVKVKLPSGRSITIPKTPSDHRSLDNLRATLRREGLTV